MRAITASWFRIQPERERVEISNSVAETNDVAVDDQAKVSDNDRAATAMITDARLEETL